MCFAVGIVDQEPRGSEAAMEELQSLAAVFSGDGADRVREELQSMDINALRRVSSAAGLPLRAGVKRLPASDLRSDLLSHVSSASGADGPEQAGNYSIFECHGKLVGRF